MVADQRVRRVIAKNKEFVLAEALDGVSVATFRFGGNAYIGVIKILFKKREGFLEKGGQAVVRVVKGRNNGSHGDYGAGVLSLTF